MFTRFQKKKLKEYMEMGFPQKQVERNLQKEAKREIARLPYLEKEKERMEGDPLQSHMTREIKKIKKQYIL